MRRDCRTPSCERQASVGPWCDLCARELEAQPAPRIPSPPPLPRKHAGKRTWSERDLLGQIEWCGEGFDTLLVQAVSVIRRAHADTDDGRRSRDYSANGGGRHYEDDGSATGAVPSMVLAFNRAVSTEGEQETKDDWRERDPVGFDLAALVGDVVFARGVLLDALARAARLRGVDRETAQKLLRKRKRGPGGHCANRYCGRWVPGTRDDRLRAGRCFDCFRYRGAHDGEERPADLCHPEEGVTT